MRHVVVEADGSYRVLDGRQWTSLRREQRERRFREALAKDPSRPDRRLLNEPTLSVPPDIAARVKPAEIAPERQLGVRASGPSPRQQQLSIDNSAKAWAAQDPITVRGDLPAGFKARLIKVLQTLDLHGLDEKDRKVMGMHGLRFVPQTDKAYDGIRDLVKTLHIDLQKLS